MPSDKKFYFLYQDGPERLDRVLAKRLAPLSRTAVQRLIKEGHVTVNDRPTVQRYLLLNGEKVRVQIPPFSSLPAAAAKSIPMLYEDKEIIVVNKPAGLVVHPAGPHREDTLIQRLWPKLAGGWTSTANATSLKTARPGVVHRLDCGTSGVMVIAKTRASAENLSRQFAARTVKKTYWALVHGIPRTETGRIRSMVGRSRTAPHRMSVKEPGRWSETEFKVLARFADSSLLEIHPLTGRTHQIRVQLAFLGHALVGDDVYGEVRRVTDKNRPLLHALSLEFKHPRTGKQLTWNAELPADFQAALRDRGFSQYG